jgi:hypothetical protein
LPWNSFFVLVVPLKRPAAYLGAFHRRPHILLDARFLVFQGFATPPSGWLAIPVARAFVWPKLSHLMSALALAIRWFVSLFAFAAPQFSLGFLIRFLKCLSYSLCSACYIERIPAPENFVPSNLPRFSGGRQVPPDTTWHISKGFSSSPIYRIPVFGLPVKSRAPLHYAALEVSF